MIKKLIILIDTIIIIFTSLVVFTFGRLYQINIDRITLDKSIENYNELYAEYKEYKSHSWELKYY